MALTMDNIRVCRDLVNRFRDRQILDYTFDEIDSLIDSNSDYQIFKTETPRGESLDKAYKDLENVYYENIDVEIKKLLSDVNTFLDIQTKINDY